MSHLRLSADSWVCLGLLIQRIHILFTVNLSLLQKRQDGPWFCVHVDCCRGEKCAQVRLVFTCVAHECCCFASLEVGSIWKETIEFGGNLQLWKLWVVAASASVSEATWKTVTLWWRTVITWPTLDKRRFQTDVRSWKRSVSFLSKPTPSKFSRCALSKTPISDSLKEINT